MAENNNIAEVQSRVGRNAAITEFFKALTKLVQAGTDALQSEKRPRGGR